MIRVRFKAAEDDPRPVNWPVKHPFWITGYGLGYATVISYADNEEYIHTNWPEATDLDTAEVNEYTFTERFPKPVWFKEN